MMEEVSPKRSNKHVLPSAGVAVPYIYAAIFSWNFVETFFKYPW